MCGPVFSYPPYSVPQSIRLGAEGIVRMRLNGCTTVSVLPEHYLCCTCAQILNCRAACFTRAKGGLTRRQCRDECVRPTNSHAQIVSMKYFMYTQVNRCQDANCTDPHVCYNVPTSSCQKQCVSAQCPNYWLNVSTYLLYTQRNALCREGCVIGATVLDLPVSDGSKAV